MVVVFFYLNQSLSLVFVPHPLQPLNLLGGRSLCHLLHTLQTGSPIEQDQCTLVQNFSYGTVAGEKAEVMPFYGPVLSFCCSVSCLPYSFFSCHQPCALATVGLGWISPPSDLHVVLIWSKLCRLADSSGTLGMAGAPSGFLTLSSERDVLAAGDVGPSHPFDFS